MPLEKSASKEAIKHNIEAEDEAGKPHDQAVAIALHEADEAKKRALFIMSMQQFYNH